MKITVRKENINFYDGKDRLKLIHLSDFHIRYSTAVLEQLLKSMYKYNPDLIVMTGDYFDIPRGAYYFREFLFKISKDYPVLFIRGNHDFMYGKKIANLFIDIPNCFCVEDSIFRYESRKGFIYNFTSWKNKLKLPFAEYEKNIVLIHNPEKIQKKKLDGIHLVLAGHLHGGQFVFFSTKNTSHFPGNLLYKYCVDRKQINNTTLLVSKGLGDTLPLRWNCPKELIEIIIS